MLGKFDGTGPEGLDRGVVVFHKLATPVLCLGGCFEHGCGLLKTIDLRVSEPLPHDEGSDGTDRLLSSESFKHNGAPRKRIYWIFIHLPASYGVAMLSSSMCFTSWATVVTAMFVERGLYCCPDIRVRSLHVHVPITFPSVYNKEVHGRYASSRVGLCVTLAG